ncbi:hypothetical protein HPB49_005309 [Dermacentor silvarum]|uniref:Uncharacterized protein n=1 Tax=Dermacentor silvarum TaxID=543639 RepID=A0ACB8DN62_DERSI|nr:hypothetical protein HPB49_005309 [Dermacentor silvarum]
MTVYAVSETHLLGNEEPPIHPQWHWAGNNRGLSGRKDGSIGVLWRAGASWTRLECTCSEHMWASGDILDIPVLLRVVYLAVDRGHNVGNMHIMRCIREDTAQDLSLEVLNLLPDCEGEFTWCARTSRSCFDYVLASHKLAQRVQRVHIDEAGQFSASSDHNRIKVTFTASIWRDRHREQREPSQRYLPASAYRAVARECEIRLQAAPPKTYEQYVGDCGASCMPTRSAPTREVVCGAMVGEGGEVKAALDAHKVANRQHRATVTAALPTNGCQDLWDQLYENTVVACLGGAQSLPVPVRRVLKQGCPLSPLVLPGLAFADDLVLLVEAVVDLQRIVTLSATHLARLGLSFNLKKSAVIQLSDRPEVNVVFLPNNDTIPWATEYRYLGVTLSASPDLLGAHEEHLRQACRRASAVLRSLWGCNRYKVVRELWEAVHVPVPTRWCAFRPAPERGWSAGSAKGTHTAWATRVRTLSRKFGFLAQPLQAPGAQRRSHAARQRVREVETEQWRSSMLGKSTLELYRSHKSTPTTENYNDTGSALLFEARAGALRTLLYRQRFDTSPKGNPYRNSNPQ